MSEEYKPCEQPLADKPVQSCNEAPSASSLVEYLHLRPPGSLSSSNAAASAEYWVDLLSRDGRPKKQRERKAAIEKPSENETSASLVNAVEAARICGVSRTTWFKLRAAGRIPSPVRLARRVLWRVEELHQWIAAGCPTLHQWQRLRDQKAITSNRNPQK